jgi:hypothetical protein
MAVATIRVDLIHMGFLLFGVKIEAFAEEVAAARGGFQQTQAAERR